MQKARSKGGDNTVSAQPSDRAVSLEGSTSNVHMPNCPSSPTLPSPWGGSQRWKEDKNRREGDQILAQQLNVCLPVHSPRRGHGYGAVDGVGKRGRTPWGVRRWPKLADTFYEEKLGITTTQRGIWWGRGAGVAPRGRVAQFAGQIGHIGQPAAHTAGTHSNPGRCYLPGDTIARNCFKLFAPHI